MLSITFELSDDLTEHAPVRIEEGRGRVNFKLHGGLFVPEGTAALNSAAELFLAGGQWFQLWKGDIVSMMAPESRGAADAGVHRGSLAHQAPGPRYR